MEISSSIRRNLQFTTYFFARQTIRELPVEAIIALRVVDRQTAREILQKL